MGMVMPPAEYLLTAGVPYVEPPIPPNNPVYAGTAAAVALQRDQHERLLRQYEKFQALRSKIRAMLLQAVPKDYTSELLDARPAGYANLTPREIMDHLMENYGTISPLDLAANRKQLARPWNPSHSIETLISHCDRCRKFAAEGQNPISDMDYVYAMVDAIKMAGVLEKAVTDWQDKPVADQTIAACKLHFKKANKNRLDNLSAATPSALDANAAIGNNAKADTKTDPAGAGKGKPKGQLGNYSYCWTHGICTHASNVCKFPAEGHQKEALIHNLMGGRVVVNVRANNNNRNGRNRRGGNQENTPPVTN
jgi:hypothetical protein